MKSRTTVLRWIKELKAEPCDRRVQLYKQGMEAALNSVLYDWPSPIQFLRFASRKRKPALAAKSRKRAV